MYKTRARIRRMMTAWHGSGQATHGCTMESPFTTDLTSLNSPCRHLPTQALLLLRSSSFSTSLDDLGQSTTARKCSMFRLSEHVTFPPFFLSLSSRTIPPPFYNDVTYRVCVCPSSTRSCRRRNWSRTRNYMRTCRSYTQRVSNLGRGACFLRMVRRPP